MSEYILILMLIAGGEGGSMPTSQSILFPSKDVCEAAKTATKAEWPQSRSVCVPRRTWCSR